MTTVAFLASSKASYIAGTTLVVEGGRIGYIERNVLMEYNYGYFNEEGTEFTVTNPNTPRAFDNFLWNDALFSNVQQTGVGYCDYQVGTGEAIQLLTGVGRICDFDVFGRDHLMSRLIYVRDNTTGEFWNINWEPVCNSYEEYSCTHGLGYTVIKTTVKSMRFEFRIFVPKGKDPVELWTLTCTNLTQKNANLSIFIYNQFQFKYKWGFDSYGDMLFRSSWFNKEQNAVIANKHPHLKPHSHLMGFITSDEPIVAFDGTRNAFVGTYNTLKEPEAVVKGQCSNTLGSADATIGVIQLNLNLLAEGKKEISIILGATEEENSITDIQNKYFGNFAKYFDELRIEKKAMIAKNRVNTPDKHFNRLLNGWIKQATLYGATWCRWGWNGYRDIVQHGLGVSTFEPERTKSILLEALKYQFKSGLALRGWNPVDEKPYSDSSLWLVFTLIAYLKETADLDLLNKFIPYYDNGSATVLEHIDQALNFLENSKGSRNLLLIKFGDWNDSLTSIGKEGRGESVWLSEAYAEALLQMADLADFMKNTTKKLNYLERYEKIKTAINLNAWDGKWYTRCFDDNGNPVGSSSNEQAKIFIEAQAWALIAGISDKDRTEIVINSCDEKLLTELGYSLLAPTFTKRDDNIGRISCLEPGICENGTIYSHTNIWMILGLLRAKKPDKAFEIFKRITPGYLSTKDYDPKQKCPPYVYANCYFGADHRNNPFQMEFTWVTGSVAWYNHVLLNDMLGAKADFRGLIVDPCIPSEWEEYEVDRFFRGSKYHMTIKNPKHLQRGKVAITVDGNKIDGNRVPVFTDGRDHEIEVIMLYSNEVE